MRKIKYIGVIVILVTVIVSTVRIYADTTKNTVKQIERAGLQIEYFSDEIISMLNELNNIENESYILESIIKKEKEKESDNEESVGTRRTGR
jgi:predicted  nucleic acid-binding Zn-ribbon protein